MSAALAVLAMAVNSPAAMQLTESTVIERAARKLTAKQTYKQKQPVPRAFVRAVPPVGAQWQAWCSDSLLCVHNAHWHAMLTM